MLAAGKYRGVILVTAYGHESILPDSFKQHKLYEDDKDQFLTKLLEVQRTDE